jgi:uncharacterized protein YbjT (DUF2867 family)
MHEHDELNAALIAPSARILVVGATGSIGRQVVAEALKQGHYVRALVRDMAKAKRVLPAQAALVVGEVTQAASLRAAVEDVDAVVFTLGARNGRDVDYGGVRNVLAALGGRHVRVSLMTAIGVTKRVDTRMGKLEGHDWKRRSERLLRASGCPYTIVRPGWFDYNEADQHRLTLLQGDARWASDPSDGVVSRQQIAEVLVRSLSTSSATCKTIELVAERGPATQDFEALFAPMQADAPGSLDAVLDCDNMPLAEEPAFVRAELAAVRADVGV